MVTFVVVGFTVVRRFWAAGSSVGARTVPVDVKTPPAIVPFQMPTFRIARPGDERRHRGCRS